MPSTSPVPTTEELLRLECLRLGVQSAPHNLGDALARADQFVKFVQQSGEKKEQ